MKKKIGNLNGKPIVSGDSNLVTDNEIYLKVNGDLKIELSVKGSNSMLLSITGGEGLGDLLIAPQILNNSPGIFYNNVFIDNDSNNAITTNSKYPYKIYSGNIYFEPKFSDYDSCVRLNTTIPYIYLYNKTGLSNPALYSSYLQGSNYGVKFTLSKSLYNRIFYYGNINGSNYYEYTINHKPLLIAELNDHIITIAMIIGTDPYNNTNAIYAADKDKNLLFLVGGLNGTLSGYSTYMTELKINGYNFGNLDDVITI